MEHRIFNPAFSSNYEPAEDSGQTPETLPTATQRGSIHDHMSYSFRPSVTLYLPSPPHNLQATSNGHDGNPPSSISLPSKKRKKKAPTLRADAWEPYKDRIVQLHIQEGQPLRKVKETMERECNFIAEYASSGIIQSNLHLAWILD